MEGIDIWGLFIALAAKVVSPSAKGWGTVAVCGLALEKQIGELNMKIVNNTKAILSFTFRGERDSGCGHVAPGESFERTFAPLYDVKIVTHDAMEFPRVSTQTITISTSVD